MAYFHCLIGGGSSGGGYELTVTCDAAFAGTTITCTDGVTTLTQTCPSVSPYEVIFAIPNGGEWTISGIISGQTYSTSIDIPDSLELHSVPEGSTVLPTDDIQTWLACAGITDKSYTTLNEVLADSTTLLALISNNNASDYLVRSTTWASGITADSTAMTDIGANDYCADTLLADSTWRAAICDSTYFESVLNAKVPTMTSNTTPSGECISTSAQTSYPNWKAFDGSSSSFWSINGATAGYIGYDFQKNVNVVKAEYINRKSSSNWAIDTFKIQYSDDGTTWQDATSVLTASRDTYSHSLNFDSVGKHRYWNMYIASAYPSFSTIWAAINELQFYGREDV